jgi:hypothetical protein
MSTLNVVVLSESALLKDRSTVTLYTAIGIEHYITAQGRSIGEAIDALGISIASTINACKELGTTPFADIGPAPEAYRKLIGRSGIPAAQIPTEIPAKSAA